MTGHTRLTDIQLVLLATAARRDNGSLLPPPETLGDGPARIRKAVQALIRRGFAIESELAAGADVWRTEGDRAIGVVITDAGAPPSQSMRMYRTRQSTLVRCRSRWRQR